MRKLRESNRIELYVVYVSGTNDITKKYDEKNYKDIPKIEESLQEVLGSDDYGIDDLWIEGIDINLDWKEILSDGARLKIDLIEMLFSKDSEEFFIKLQFCNNEGLDIEESILDDIIVYNARHDGWVSGRDSRYPIGIIDGWSKEYYPSLKKELEKANAESYFNWVNLFSDDEIRGKFLSEIINDNYFVYYTEF